MDKKQLIALQSKMTIEEKLGQLTQSTGEHFIGRIDDEMVETGPRLEDLALEEKEIHTIGSVLGSSSAKITNRIQRNYLEKSRLKIPLLFMHDAIHGYRTIFPIPLALACSFDEELLRKVAAFTATELRAAGIHVNFSPMVDLVRDARWGRVTESFGEDHILSGSLGKAMTEGYQKEEKDGSIGKEGVAACLKHFAAYGAVEAGKDYAGVDMSLKEFFGFYARPYEIALKAKPRLVMSSFSSFQGEPATASKFLLQEVLRDRYGFHDLIISDWGAVAELKNHGIAENDKEAGAAAFAAGVDIEMASSSYLRYGKELLTEHEGLTEKLDQAVWRVLNLKNDLGLFEQPFTDEAAEDNKLRSKEAIGFAKESAKESCVLLKNEEVLPICRDKKNIIILGPYAKTKELLGNWYCKGRFEETVSLEEGMRKVFKNSSIKAYGTLADCTKEELQEADALILTIGESWELSGEGHSSSKLELAPEQQELIRSVKGLGKRYVCVAFAGRPLALGSIIEDIPALLWCWYPGSQGGEAVAELIGGISSPAGKLSMSFPRVTGQVPLRYNELRSGRPANDTSYSSRYQDCEVGPLFPFGYGLSYADIRYSNYAVSNEVITEREDVALSMDITNHSNFPAKETILLYMENPIAKEVRPVRELLSYQKIELKALEQKTVQFIIRADDLKYINRSLVKVLEPGIIKLYVNNTKQPAAEISYY